MIDEDVWYEGANGQPYVGRNLEILKEAINSGPPKGAMSLLSPTVHNLNDATYVVADFNVNVTERGGIVVDLIDNTITVDRTSTYEASFGVDCDFPAGEELVITFFINDVEIETTPFSLQGGGSGKPNSISWTTTVPLVEGDKLDMRFKNGDTGDFSANIRRMFFSLQLDI